MATAARRRIRWLQLAAWCTCGRRVADQVPATELRNWRGRDPEEVVGRKRCRARGCGEMVEITGAAYLHAGKRVEATVAAG